MTFKLGIVSSYDVLCGNATYSQALLDGLPSNYEAVKIHLPIHLQKFRDVTAEKSILQEVAICDAVNIQMELGLYGATPKAGAKFIKKIIKRSRRVSLTMHRVEEKPLNFIRNFYNQIKAGELGAALFGIVKREVSEIYKDIISFAHRKNATFIVHTNREKNRILRYQPGASVIVHPIVWPDDYCVEKVDLNRMDPTYSNIFTEDERPLIGLFGFMSDYKNFLQVVRVAVNTNKYRILLAGGTHPQSPEYGQKIITKPKNRRYKENSQSQKKMSGIEEISVIYMNLSQKKKSALKAMHSPEDQELIRVIKTVDIVVIPYTEVGQSASGIASMAVQFGKRVLFSDTHTSRLLSDFLNRTPEMFDTKSDLSLASALEKISQEDENTLYFKSFDFQSNVQAYLKSLKVEQEN